MKAKGTLASLATAAGLLLIVAFTVLKLPTLSFAGYGVTERAAGFYTVVDENNQPLLETGWLVYQGDQFITADDRCYQVTRVSGDTAYASPADFASVAGIEEPDSWIAVPAQTGQKLIGMYHTHSDESYTPPSGRASRPGKGDIFAVGDAFTAALQAEGFAVQHDKTPHDPHDSAAYKRSRRTAAKLFKQGPYALFDVHRDSAPAKAYRTTVNGQTAAKVMMVIGRQNPKRSVNIAVARSLKAAADKKYPGLVRAIFMGRGAYNQDLDAQAILFEFGTEKQPLEEAKRSTAYIADVVAEVFGATPPTAAPAPTPAPTAPLLPKLFGFGNYTAPQN